MCMSRVDFNLSHLFCFYKGRHRLFTNDFMYSYNFGTGFVKFWLGEAEGGLGIYKKSADASITAGNPNYSLIGAEYGVWKDGSNYGGSPDYTMTTKRYDADPDTWAFAGIDGLPAGVYWVREISPSKGYGLDRNDHGGHGAGWFRFTVSSGQTPTQNYQYSTEPLDTGGIGIYKRSADNSVDVGGPAYTLVGAEYGIWRDGSDYNGNPTYTMKAGSYANDCTFAHLDGMPLGVYWVREIKAPPGYDLDRADHGGHGPGWFKFTVTANKSSSQNTQNSYDPPLYGTISLKKTSTSSSITDGNPMYSLEGAEYSVYNARTNNVIATIRTNAAGEGSVTKIPLDKYYVKETKAPDSQTNNPSYRLDPNKYEFEITANNHTNLPVIKSQDEPITDPGMIIINKSLDHGKVENAPPLTGTEFTVRYYATLDRANYKSHPIKAEWVFGIKWSEKNQQYQLGFNKTHWLSGSDLYYDETGQAVLPIGTYEIQETKPAAGYELEGTITYKERDPVTGKWVPKTQSVADPFITQVTDGNSGISLMVDNVSMTNEATPISLKVMKNAADGTPLQGVKFKIESVSDPSFQFEYDPEQTTDSSGMIVFDKLEPGDYIITETQTVDGNMLLVEPIKVSVPMKMTQEQVQENHVDTNQPYVKLGADGMYYIYEFTYNVTNTPTLVMPMTGGIVTPMTFLPLVGGMGLFGAVAFMGFRKKKKHMTK